MVARRKVKGRGNITLEVGSRHIATRKVRGPILVCGEKLGGWGAARGNRRHGSGVVRLCVRDGIGIRPVGRGPGKLGHSGIRNRRARELLL
jgi:hypothetical protein